MSTILPPLDVGLHYDIPASRYHADPAPGPSLSSSLALKIIKRSLAHACAEHPRLGGGKKKDATDAMDMGGIVHALLAGKSEEEIALGDFDSFRGKAAKEFAVASRAAGKIPALAGGMPPARKIAQALREKAARGITDNPFTSAKHEVTAIWKKNDAYFRARFDALFAPANEPWTIWDWKVTGDVSVEEVKRKFRRFGYHLRAAHYLAAADALCPQFAGRHSFVFAFVEDDAPYSVRRFCLKQDTRGVAAIDMGKAHTAWADAIRTNEWPDATRDQTTMIDIPNFAEDDEEPDGIKT